MKKSKKIIISGGGTGGHIFPAISIANALKRKEPSVEILFVGAENRMEMQKVPAAGYEIKGLPVTGFQRKLTFKNILFFLKLFSSLVKSVRIIKSFAPDVVVGVGGYASGPVLKMATRKGIPTLIQEQNSYAGVTNRLLAKKVKKICVAYEGMEKYFPKEKILLTGNPVRQDILTVKGKAPEAFEYFGLEKEKKVLLIIGGSLGSKSINEGVLSNLGQIRESNIQVIWQTGGTYFWEAKKRVGENAIPGLIIQDFISRMDFAYAVSDLVISRAGAGSISELCLVGKPVILVPSPNVAEDHQTKNAMALVNRGAAILVKDKEAKGNMIIKALELIRNKKMLSTLSKNIAEMGIKDSADKIANEIFKLIEK